MEKKEDKNIFDRSYNKGEKNPMSKISEQDVKEIRELYENGARPIKIARKFGISNSLVHAIIRRQSWKHVS